MDSVEVQVRCLPTALGSKQEGSAAARGKLPGREPAAPLFFEGYVIRAPEEKILLLSEFFLRNSVENGRTMAKGKAEDERANL